MTRPLVLVLNGPNLDTLGTRQPEIYGTTTLAQIEASLTTRAADLQVDLEFVQSNDETVLIDSLRSTRASAAIMNPAAFTHYSVGLRDAVEESGLPLFEVHISNIYAREPMRRHSVISPAAVGVICGLGPDGYIAALDAAARHLAKGQP